MFSSQLSTEKLPSVFMWWMWNNFIISMSYIINTFHTPGNFSALSWDRIKTKPVLRSYINRLSIMGSFVMKLQELPVCWYHEYEKTLIPVFFGSHCITSSGLYRGDLQFWWWHSFKCFIILYLGKKLQKFGFWAQTKIVQAQNPRWGPVLVRKSQNCIF